MIMRGRTLEVWQGVFPGVESRADDASKNPRELGGKMVLPATGRCVQLFCVKVEVIEKDGRTRPGRMLIRD